MQSKIKKHFSLVMVSKSIHKTNKKKKHTVEIILQTSPQYSLSVPKFLDPITCYHLYGDICFNKTFREDGTGEIGLLSNYNYFKRVKDIVVSSQYISLSIENTSDEMHPWDFLMSRLNTLNNIDAHELVQVLQMIIGQINSTTKKEDGPTKLKNPICTDYDNFRKDLDTYCQENSDKLFSMFRFRMQSEKKGLELKEIRHSKKAVEFFSENMETFTHLVLEQGILDVWAIEEKDYFKYMRDSLTNFLYCSKQMGLYAKTMEGDKIYFYGTPCRKMMYNGEFTEIVAIMSYDIEEKKLERLQKKRDENKSENKKSFREQQLQQTLDVYYGNFIENRTYIQQNLKNGMEGYEKNNVYLAEKKRCGIKSLYSK